MKLPGESCMGFRVLGAINIFILIIMKELHSNKLSAEFPFGV